MQLTALILNKHTRYLHRQLRTDTHIEYDETSCYETQENMDFMWLHKIQYTHRCITVLYNQHLQHIHSL